RMGVSPVAYLMGETICANIGSTATLIGNPQNAYIGITSGISFLYYAAVMTPVTGLCLAVAIPMMLRFFRKDLSAATTGAGQMPAADRRPVDRTLIRVAGAVFGTVLVLFILSSLLHLSIAAIAMGGGVFMLFSTVS